MRRFDMKLFTFCYKHEIWQICAFLHAYQYVIWGQSKSCDSSKWQPFKTGSGSYTLLLFSHFLLQA